MRAETIPTNDRTALDVARAEARLPRWMAGLAVAGTLVAGAIEGARFGAGFALGAALAILNYFWLHQAVAALFSAGQARVPASVIAKFALRYPLAIAGLYPLYKTGWLPFTAILAGLFVPVGGVLIEAIIQIRQGLRPS